MTSFRGARFLAILDTMWGRKGRAPHWFPISPANHSGKMLYKLTDSKFPAVWVTNCCREQVRHAHQHGKPDVSWLEGSLLRLPDWCQELPLLVCGRVAQNTWFEGEYLHLGPVLFFPHPAARNWSVERIEQARSHICQSVG